MSVVPLSDTLPPTVMLAGVTVPTVGVTVVPVGTVMVTEDRAEVELVVEVYV